MSSINSQTKYGEMYRDYANNFLTVEKFAEHYGISIDVAVVVIGAGRMIQDDRAEIDRLRKALQDVIEHRDRMGLGDNDVYERARLAALKS